jgi:hypothetical protein
MLRRSHFYVSQGFEVSAAQNHLFPGITLNGQLLTLEGNAGEGQCEQQPRERKGFLDVTLEESLPLLT